MFKYGSAPRGTYSVLQAIIQRNVDLPYTTSYYRKRCEFALYCKLRILQATVEIAVDMLYTVSYCTKRYELTLYCTKGCSSMKSGVRTVTMKSRNRHKGRPPENNTIYIHNDRAIQTYSDQFSTIEFYFSD